MHNPKILIEGTISGIKKDPPPTLKSIFEGNINDEIILNNNNSLKPSEYKLSKFDIPEYLKKAKDSNISEASLKIDDNNFKINNESKDNANSLELKNLDEIIKGDIDTKIQINKGDTNIKNPEDNLEKLTEIKKAENPIENINIDIPSGTIELKGPSLKGPNIGINQPAETKIEGIIEGIKTDPNKEININVPNMKDDIQLEINKNLDLEGENKKEKIPIIEGDININENTGKLNIPDLSGKINIDNDNIKGEIIEGKIPGLKKEMKPDDVNNIPESKNLQTVEDIILPENEKKEELNKEKESKIYESITGSIVGTPRQKYLVEYGSTKGYKRPNIKKGKDFTHNPEIVIEGTISGIKKIPPTLKSMLEDKVNNNIQLNKISNHSFSKIIILFN